MAKKTYRCSECGREYLNVEAYYEDLDRHTDEYEAQYPYRPSQYE